jgi:tRNA G10  N-methylase Trm11
MFLWALSVLEPLLSNGAETTHILFTMSTPLQYAYSFISGKNWKLSLAELVTFFEARNIAFEVTDFSRPFFTIRTEQPLSTSVIDGLGGSLKIAQVEAFVPTKHVTDAFEKKDKAAKKQLTYDFPLNLLAERMPRADSGKAVFGVSVYWADPLFKQAGNLAQRYLGSALKDELKEQDKKARFMGFPRDRENPQLTPVEVLKQGLVENHAEVLLCIGKEQTSIGATMAVHNPFEFQKRDVEKPVQRKIFGISPRIAKIMVNLTGCTAGKTFLDPFCGVGNVLQEALLADAKVIGMDINRWCVDAAKRNLAWLSDEYSLRDPDYVVIQGDSRNLSQKIRDEVDCIATEPDLGPALREVATRPYAEKLVDNLVPLFEDFLSEAYLALRAGGRLAIVTPYVRTRSGSPVTMNVDEMAESAGLTPIQTFKDVQFVESAADFPLKDLARFVDMDDRHKIGREIHLYQKNQ